MRFSAAYRDAPIRRKLVFIAVLATVSATLFAILALTAEQWFQQSKAMERNLYAQATIVAANSKEALIFNDRETARQTLASLAAIDNIEFAELFDKTGKDFAVYVRPGTTFPPHQHHAAEGARNIYTMTYLEIVVPVDSEQQQIGMIHVRSSMAPVYETLAWNLLMIVAAAGGALLVALILGLRLLPTITAPLQSLIELMQTVSRNQNYGLRAELHGQDEVGRLAEGFNGMLVQIQRQNDTLVQHRQHLEDVVEQRTADLKEANRQLAKELSDRTVAEQRLLTVNEQLSILLDSLPIAVYRCRAEGDYAVLYMSHNVVAFTGYDAGDFITETDLWFRRIHPDDAAKVTDEIIRMVEPGKHAYEYRWQHADGSYRWISDSLKLIRPEDGSPPYMVGMWQDVTERKRFEIELSSRTAFFEALVNTSADGIIVVDQEGRKILQNRRATELWQIPEEIAADPDDSRQVQWVMDRTVDPKQFVDKVLYLYTHRNEISQDEIALKDGTILERYSAPVLDNDGHPYGRIWSFRDITERKLAEEKIRKQQELTSLIIETIPMRVFWKDRDLRYLGCNTLFAHDAGMPDPEAMVGKTDFEMGWKDQAALYQADDRRVMETNTPRLSYDEPQTTPNGGQIWLRTSKVPLRNEAHETIGLLGVYEDITERQLAARALEQSELRFRTILESAVDGILVADGQTHQFVTANQAICDMLGYSQAEVYRLGLKDIHPVEAMAFVQKQFQRQLKGEIRVALNLPVQRKDGSVFFADVSSSPMTLAGHAFLIGIFHDVTERRQAETELRLFRELLDNSSDAVEVLDPATLRFLDVNLMECTALGYSREELLTMGVADIDPDFGPGSHGTVEEQLRNTGFARFEAVHRRRDGSIFPVEISSRLIELDRPYLLNIVRDITERKQAEERNLRLNEELEEKVRERTQQLVAAQETLVRNEKLAVLGQVAGSVGHELRNPLGVMSNAVYFLQTVLADADETTQEYLNIIKDEIAGSERIVSDLLDSVRTKPPRLETVDVKELIDRTLVKCNVPPGVRVEIEIPEKLPPLRVDPLQIHQVFRNLIANGIDAMSEGGTLTIQASEDALAGTIAIAVQDTGCGMTHEQMDKLFQPLFTTKARGIGLGLVVVKNLTEANGGQVKVQSKPGKGTIFAITLPMVEGKGNDHG
jgi:PAS domain S-box-containing protein